ncbi:MAG: SUMF1/EgtB/PvdO family nonheme iron enzyme [Acidobacteria bacterium]|nr:SUMF1/EgtB/PvdO family nonheme iron enzyme [Acidobacteriota bacterium]
MKRAWSPRARLAALVAAAVAFIGLGLAVERADLFPRLRFAVQRTALQLPSTVAVDRREVVSGLPLLSVYLEPEDLEFLLKNKLEQGPDFERRATVSYFNEGRLLFTGAAGIRVHGGGSRLVSPRQGFRLFFRRRHGFTRFGDGILFGPASQPLQRLVVHNDVRYDRDGTAWHLVNPFGYDVARRIGCITPETLPARFFLNGEDQGLFVLTEHFDDEYFASHRPGERITMELADMVALRDRLNAAHPFTMEEVRAEIDLDNLVSWYLATIFLATRDAYQGPGQFLDETSGRWFWVTWDVDQSLRNWDHESYQYLLNVPGERERGRRPSEPRPFVFGTLLAEDQAFRDYYASRVDTMLNHQLTQDFLDERRAHYEEVADRFGVEATEYRRRIREFVARRRAYVREITEQWLDVPRSVRVTVRREAGGSLTVDGFEKKRPFEGFYFPGRAVQVRTTDGEPVRWFVNGSPVEVSPELPLRADGPLEVVAVPPASGFVPAGPAEAASAGRGAAVPESAPARPIEWRRVPAAPSRPAFEIAATETTVGQFRAFSRATATPLPRQPHWSDEDHPVVNLTWAEASAFCTWAGGRLPTEAEWESAASAGGTGQYGWGDTWDPSRANAAGVAGNDVWGYTSPVASFPPNALGLYDMVGNVWEWTADLYSPEPANRGRRSLRRAVRGGSWANRRENVRLSCRDGLSESGRHNLHVGIRCVR